MNNNQTFSSTIIDWFHENGRSLPWRETKNPYAIWLSEIILQQTRINQGREYWERFMQQYPTVEKLAMASEDDVLKLWQGLGYYSRARNLHAAARQIVALGKFPDTIASIRALKGVGDYTAAAISSFAFDIPAAVVDGNVYRVLSRYFGIVTPINSTRGKKEFDILAHSLLPSSDVAAYNQGIMDFGAIQCTPQSPKCLICPLAETCGGLREGKVDELPVKTKQVKVKTRRLTYIYIRCKGQTAIHRRGEGDIWQGLWEPYNAIPHAGSSAVTLAEIQRMLSLSPSAHLRLLAKEVKHVLTHRILLADFYLLEADERPKLPEDYIWIEEDDMEQYGVPRLIEIMLEKIYTENHGQTNHQ